MKKRENRLKKPIPKKEVTPEWITGQLKKLLSHGAYADELHRVAPDLVDVLSPKSDLGLSDKQRAWEAENVIKSAIEKMAVNYEETIKDALWAIFAFTEGEGLRGRVADNDKTLMMKRRRFAGRILGIEPFRL